jgi:hypothetical protein
MKSLFYSVFSLFLLALIGSREYRVMGQATGIFQNDSIRTEVQRLLGKYELYHNSLNDSDESSADRNFIRLFSNPKILVLQDFIGDTATGMMSVQDYTNTLMDKFPEGVEVKFLYATMEVGRPRYDRDDRYIVRAQVNQTKSAVLKGKVLTSDHRVVFLIAFTWDGELAQDFTIHGIQLPPQKSDFLIATGAGGITGIRNSLLAADDRFSFTPSVSFSGGLEYLHQFNNHWGGLIGVHYSVLNSAFTLDEFDQVGGFPVPFADIVFSNRFWMLNIPVEGVFRFNMGNKLSFAGMAGVSAGIRIFETQLVSAYNQLLESRFDHVISDPDWYYELNRFELQVVAEADLIYWLREGLGIMAGVSFAHGITSLDHLVRADAEYSKYLGQYNPLWANSAATLPWKGSFNLGLWISINQEQK